MNEKLKLTKTVNQQAQKVNSLEAGIAQIWSLFTQVAEPEDPESMLGQITSRYFDLLNSHECAMLQKQHELDVMRLEQEVIASLKMDLEIARAETEQLTQEVGDLCQELDTERQRALS